MRGEKTMTGVVRKVGGSLMVRIPKIYATKNNIKEGDTIEFFVTMKRKKDFSWAGSMSGTGGWTPEVKKWLRGADRDN